LCLYTSISVPFSLGFYAFADYDQNVVGFVIDVIIDILYIVDVFVSWRTTYYDREGALIVDKKLARQRYLSTWFGPDVFASFPYEHLVNLCSLGVSSRGLAPPALKLPSLAKLLRIMRLGKKIDRLSSSKLFRITQFTGALLLAAHWYACLWFYFGSSSPPDDFEGVVNFPGQNGTSWVFRTQVDHEGVAMQYFTSLYWALTMLMKSPWLHPISPSEFAGATFMIIIGCVLYGYFIGNVTAIITAANAAGGRYRGQISALKAFSTSHGLSAATMQRLLIYQDALWTETFGGTDRSAMLKGVPPHLLPQVTIEMYRPLLDACPFLFDCSAAGAAEFLKSLQVRVCDRGDMLLRAGAMSQHMYILQRGELKINFDADAPKETAELHVPGGRIGSDKAGPEKTGKGSKDAMRGRTDKAGTLVGFQDVFKKFEPIQYTVTALSRCTLLSITRGELKTILTTYEEDKEHVMAAITKAEQTMKGGARRSCIGSTPGASPSMGLIDPSEVGKSSPVSQRAGSPPQQLSKDPEIASLQNEVAALRGQIEPMHALLARQSKMLERLLAHNNLSA